VMVRGFETLMDAPCDGDRPSKAGCRLTIVLDCVKDVPWTHIAFETTASFPMVIWTLIPLVGRALWLRMQIPAQMESSPTGKALG